jgi:hypothetical protein
MRPQRPHPPIGSVFHHKYKGEIYTLTVIEKHGAIKYEILGENFDSPTAAAKRVVGNQFINGRRFWRIDG